MHLNHFYFPLSHNCTTDVRENWWKDADNLSSSTLDNEQTEIKSINLITLPQMCGHLPLKPWIQGCIQKFLDWVNNEIYTYNGKLSLRSNTKGYGSKIHQTDSQNSYTTAPNDRELYHMQFLLQAANPKTSGYTLIFFIIRILSSRQYPRY
jgi:hypothetical protein